MCSLIVGSWVIVIYDGAWYPGTVMNIEDFRIRFSKVSRVQRPSIRFQVDWSSGHEETHRHLRVVQTGARYP